jgi:hypothetical protein
MTSVRYIANNNLGCAQPERGSREPFVICQACVFPAMLFCYCCYLIKSRPENGTVMTPVLRERRVGADRRRPAHVAVADPEGGNESLKVIQTEGQWHKVLLLGYRAVARRWRQPGVIIRDVITRFTQSLYLSLHHSLSHVTRDSIV